MYFSLRFNCQIFCINYARNKFATVIPVNACQQCRSVRRNDRKRNNERYIMSIDVTLSWTIRRLESRDTRKNDTWKFICRSPDAPAAAARCAWRSSRNTSCCYTSPSVFSPTSSPISVITLFCYQLFATCEFDRPLGREVTRSRSITESESS